MIRKAIIVVLTLGAVTTGSLGLFKVPWMWTSAEVPSSSFGQLGAVGFLRGDFAVLSETVLIETVGVGIEPEVQEDWTWTLPHIRYGRSVLNHSDGKALEMIGFRISATFLSILFAAYPTIVFIRGPLRRWRRCRKGLCPDCAYDLTGNESGVCPECGKPIP